MVEIKNEELFNISGGTLTAAAASWIERNRSTIISRAPSYLRGMVEPALSYVQGDSNVYDIADLQSMLQSYGVNTYDLV